MTIFEKISIAREIMAFSIEVARGAVEVARLIHAGRGNAAAHRAQVLANEQAAGKAAYEASRAVRGSR